MRCRPVTTPRPLASSLARFSSAAAMLAALAMAGSTASKAATLQWDPNGTTDAGATGGTGTWDNVATNLSWFDGVSNVAWPNTDPGNVDEAVFGGTAGTVTLGVPIFVNKLTFNVGGYTISNGGTAANTLTLSGTTPTISITNSADNATISAIVGGTAGLTKAGAGTLTLSGANTFTGGVFVNAGTLSVSADANLGAAANGLTLAGTLSAGTSFSTARAIALSGVNGTFNVTGAGTTLTSSGVISGTGGALNKTGTGTLALTGTAANTFSGPINISEGALSFTADNQLGTGTTINLSNGAGFTYANTTTQATLGATRIITVGTGGGFLSIPNASPSITTSKFSVTGAGQITGAGDFTKAGAGLLTLGGANSTFTGNWFIGGGVLEANSGALNSRPVTINGVGTTTTSATTGELATNSDLTQAITINGGILSPVNGNRIISGSVNSAANSTIALRDFYATGTARNLTISSALTGAGNITVVGPTSGTGTLALSGDRSGHTGAVAAGANTIVQANSFQSISSGGFTLAGGTLQVRVANSAVSTLGTPGLNAFYYNFGSNPNAANNPNQFAVDQLYLSPRVFTRTDANIDIPNGGSGTWPIIPVPGFATGTTAGGANDGVMWKGLLNVTSGGSYQFSGINDDNLILYIDGQQVGTLGVQSANTNIGSAVNLSAGAHSIVVKQSQGGGGGYARLSWNGPDSNNTTVTIPASAFTNGSLGVTDIGPISVTANSTLDIIGPSSTTSLKLGNGVLTLTSPTIDNLTVTGVQITAATPTLAPTTAGLIVADGITQASPGLGLNIAGPYFTEFQGANSYTGLTKVTGGQLRLNRNGGPSIAGDLTIDSPNASGAVANVRLLQSNQIADTATVTVNQGILDIDGTSDTIANLVLGSATTSGTILGSGGVLTVNNAPTLNSGYIAAGLGGNYTLNKAGSGTVVLAGNSTYTGQTTVSSGILNVRGLNALGVGGSGNGTSVASGATLQLVGADIGAENIVVNGTGVTESTQNGAIRHLGGTSAINDLSTGSAATVQVDSGELIVNGALTVGAGALTKTGAGTLTFASNQSSIPAVTVSAGALGFKGPQSFGAVTVPAGLAYQFDSDPGSGVSVTVNSGSTVIGNYNINQAFLSRLGAASNGTLALTADNSNALDFSAGPNVSLGATKNVVYSGTITPNSATYRLGGGGGRLQVTSTLSGTNALQINGDVHPNAENSFTGAITVNSGRAIYVNDSNYGASANIITLNGGTLQIASNGDQTGGALFVELGNQLNGGGRVVSIGAGGGTIDIPARQAQGNLAAFTAPNTLIGSGALKKTGLGLMWVFNPQSYSGDLTLDSNSNRLDIRAAGSLANVASITLNSRAELDVDNATGAGQRQFAGQYVADRVNNSAPITFNGGILLFTPRGAAGQISETFGAVTLNAAQNEISSNSNPSGSVGAVLNFGALTRGTGSTLRLGGSPGTLGAGTAGAPGANNTQITFSSGLAASPVVGFATQLGTDLVQYDTTVGFKLATYNATAVAADFGANNNILNLGADVTLAAGTNQVNAFKLSGAATRQLLFNAATDTLYVSSGGIVSDGSNNARNIGNTTIRGQLTAGPATGNTVPRELFLHNNANTLTINSTIVDNNGQAVSVVKDLDGTVTLDSGTNSYSGGTFVTRGTLTANNTGSLGTGAVLVRNSTLNLGNKGSTTGAVVASNQTVYSAVDNAEIVLTNTTAGAVGAYNAAGDRFSIDAGSVLYANSPGAGFGLNSLTRVASPTSFTTGGPLGQVYLAPGSIIRHNMTNAADQATGTLTVQNLGTNADLFFAPGTSGGVNQTLTVGAGTPWAGISTPRGSVAWTQGTIFANSDFTLQGLVNNGGVSTLTLGNINTGTAPTGGISIVNNSNTPINAKVVGAVAIAEDEPVFMPGNLTFVLTAGSIFQPNTTAALGFGSTQAKVLVQAGATLDPGNYTAIGATAGQNTGALASFQNLPYPVPSPVNGNVTVEAGGRFLINDTSGIGSAPVGSYLMKTGSILDLGNTNAFYGRGNMPFDLGGPVDTTGVINPGQFVFEPGVITRIQADNIYKLSQFMPSNQPVIEIFNGTRTLTNQNNPFIIPAVGTPTIAPENVTISNGTILTNDNADRQISEGRGRLIIGDGGILAATTQTYLNIQESIDVQAGATVSIGSNKIIDGLPKTGGIQLLGPNSNTIPASATINMLEGTQILLSAANTWPDSRGLNLPLAVTFPAPAGSTGILPGTGTSLGLNTANFVEVMGALTGNGAVIANQGGTALAVGFGATSDFTFNGVFKSTNGQNPGLWKIGPTKMTLTGVSDSSESLVVEQGELALSGAGAVKFTAGQRALKGATLTIDNSGTPLNNRLGNPSFLIPSGGTYNLIGNATTPVTEAIQTLANSTGTIGTAGGTGSLGFANPAYTRLNITPGAATTTLSVGSVENFQSAGISLQRSATWVVSSPAMSNLPGTVAINGVYTPNAGNTLNGAISIANPNFISNGAFGVGPGGTIINAPGTPVVPTRPDILWANANGEAQGFVTEDGVLVAGVIISGQNTMTVSVPSRFTVGQTITGTAIPAGTTVTAINGNVLTLSANATGTAGSLNSQLYNFADSTVNYLRPLQLSEYSSTMRDNQSTSLNVKLSGTTTTSGDTRVQTLTLAPGSVLNIDGTLPLNTAASRLHLNGAGVFVQAGGASTINGTNNTFLQANGGASLFLHTQGDLNLNTMAFSDNGVVKTGPGTLNVGAGAFTAFRGTLQIDGGTVNLAAGNGFANFRGQNGFTTNENLFLNGGTLNLNGNSQFVNQLTNSNPLPGQGGTLTSATPATVTVNGGGIFSGQVTNAISLDKTSNNTLLLTNDNPYTGTTLVRTGTLALRDSGRLSGTAGIEIQNATLQLDNSYLSNVADRIPATTPVILKGATLNITGAAGQVASQTFNSLTLAAGLNQFTSNAGGSGANEINIGNLIRPAGGGAFINFNQNYGFLGTAGNTSTAIRNFITNINGSQLALNDGVVAGWAVVGGSNFATYLPGQGIGAMGNTADGFANYSSTDITTAGVTDNVNDNGTARTLAASKTINSLRAIPTAAATYTFNSGVGLTIDSGGFLTDANQTLSLSAATGASGNFITSNSGELDVWVNQNTTGINIPITGNLDLVKSGPQGLNIRPEASFNGTVTSGSNTVTMTATTGLVAGMPVSGTGIPAGTTIASVNPGVSITLSNNATAAGTAVTVGFGNTYTGKTIVNGGTLTLNMGAANPLGGFVAVPGDLVVNGATVTEANVGGQLKLNANITVTGGGRFNVVNAPGVTETIGSLTALDAAGTGVASGFNTILDRSSAQFTSTVNLSAPTAITSTNTNPSIVPLIGSNLGIVGFTNATGSKLDINSPTTVNGLAAVGLRIDAQIGTVPTGVAGGGLIKAGSGILALNPLTNPTFAGGATTNASNSITVTSTTGLVPGMQVTGTNIPAGSYVVSVVNGTTFTINQNATATGTGLTITGQVINSFGSPTTLTDVLNVQSGIVRADVSGALGSNFANTTVQGGAVLLGANPNNANQVMTGSVTLKDGASLGGTINAFTLGAATLTSGNQSVLNIPSGTVNIAAYDYFVPATNAGNITVNGRLTGAGNISLVGPQITQGTGGGGVFTLGNPILTGTGATDYSGTIIVGTNAILKNQVALIAGSGITRTTGNALGSATINLNGGRLQLRDDGQATGDTNNQTVTYGNNVTLSADSFIDGNRQTSSTVTGTTIGMGTLTVPSGAKTLTVDSGNSYVVRFNELDGPGMLVKAGNSLLTINALGTGASTPSFGIAGPQGRTVGSTFNTTTSSNVTFVPASNTFQDFAVNGFYITPASKTFNVNGTFSVGTNADNVSGAVALTGSTTLNAGVVRNDGTIGAIGTGTITASTAFRGKGIYQTFGAAGVAGGTTTLSSNPLTLAGNFDSGTLRVAGNNTVTINGSSITPTATEVQSGTLRLAPTSGAVTSSGTVRVFGSPSSAASTTSAPINAVSATLQLDGNAGAITHTGNIVNNGTVQVSAGTATVAGIISGTETQYVPGLLEGFVTTNTLDTTIQNRPANPGNFGIRLEPRMLQTNAVTQQALTGHTDNDLWIYTGYVKDDDGVFSFAENIDDRAAVWIDGQLVLNASNGGTSRVVSTAYSVGQQGTIATPGANSGVPSQNFGPGISLPGRGDGWHLIEIRMNNGAGGAGPIAGNGFAANYGFGYKNGIAALDGSDMIKPIDDGTGNLFVTPVGGSGKIDIAANASLKVQGFKLISSVTLNGDNSALEVTGAGANDTDAIVSNGGTAANPNKLTLASGANVAAGNLTVATGGAFRLAGSASSNLSIGGSAIDGTLELDGGAVGFTGTSTGTTGVVNVKSGSVAVSVGGSLKGSLNVTGGSVDVAGNGVLATSGFVDGGLTQSAGAVNVGGVVVGDVAVSGGTFKGDGAILGGLSVTGGLLAPGNTFGTLATGNLSLQAPAKLSIEIGGSPLSTSNDQLVVSGGVSLAGELQGSLLNGFTPHNGDTFYIILNDGTDTVTGTFQGLAQNSVVNFGGFNWAVTYTANGDGGSIGNDVALIAQVPEPNSAATLVAALGALTGLQRFRRRRS